MAFPNFKYVAWAIGIASASIPSTSIGQDTGGHRAVLVLDASGSMWGQIESIPKIEIARDAVAEMVSEWDQTVDLGLIAYGHNRRGDCTDIEVLRAPETLDETEFLATVNALTPIGKTPLTDAVVLAAEALRYTEQKATVILLTDGLETCGQDPCTIGTRLEAQGIDFTAHVIGFDVAQEDSSALSCLAENTGGLYLPARDTQGLTDALQKVSTAAVLPKVAKDISPATILVPDQVVVGSMFKAQWTGPNNLGDQLRIRDENGHAVGGQPVRPDNLAQSVDMLAPPKVGTYTIFYEVVDHDTPLGSAVLNVVTVLPSITAPETVQFGGEFDITWTGPGASGDRLLVINPTNGEIISTDQARASDNGEATLRAPEIIGTFEIQLRAARTGKTRASTTFNTTPVAASITLPDGPFHAGDRSMPVDWTGPRNQGDRLRVFERDTTTSLSQRPVFGTAKSPTNVTLPRKAGAYTLKLISTTDTVYAEQDFDVLPAR